MKSLNIMIVGVGGQGTLLASRIIGAAAAASGYDVKVSEVHGMSQRGGSVVTYVRFGSKVDSPLITRGEADVVISFERLEALRWCGYLKAGGIIIANEQEIDPMPVITGARKYPEGIMELLQGAAGKEGNVVFLDAGEIARDCGSIRAVNTVLLGVLAGMGVAEIDKDVWIQAVKNVVPQKALEINLKAFEAGCGRGNGK